MSKKTIKNYVSDVRLFARWLDEQGGSLTSLQGAEVENYVAHLAEIGKPQTSVNRYLASLRKFEVFWTARTSLRGSQEELVYQMDRSAKTADLPAPSAKKNQPLNVPSVNQAPKSDQLPKQKILEQFAQALAADGCKANSIKNYVVDIDLFAKHYSAIAFNEVCTKPKVADYLRQLRFQGLAKSTVRRREASLKKFTAWAVKEGFISQDPFENGNQNTKMAKPVFSLFRSQPKLDNSNGSPQNLSQAVTNLHSGSNSSSGSSNASSSSSAASWSGWLSQAFRRYNDSRVATYLHLAILIIFATSIGIFGYQQFVSETDSPLAYPSAPVTPGRILSFQGRVTDTGGTPITSPINMEFRLYNSEDDTGTNVLLWETSPACSIDPDDDGIFSTILGQDCGSGIGPEVFSENSQVWLEVQVASEILEPRQRIASVAYALNSETLQGFPPSLSGDINTIPVINALGELIIGANNPKLIASSGAFLIQGESMIFRTETGTGGDITFQPDGEGTVNFYSSTTDQNSIYVSNPNLTSGNLIHGYIGNNTATGNLLYLSSGSTEEEKFSVSASGNTRVAGNLTVDTNTLFVDAATNRVGIGTTAPGQALEVDGNALIQGSIIVGNGASSLSQDSNQTRLHGSSGLKFTTWNGGVLEAMRIAHTTGYVGIGTTAPASLFSVGANNAFQVNSTGNIVALGGAAHSISNVSGDLSIDGEDDLLLSDARVTNLRLSESDTALHANLSQAIVDAINDVYGMATGSGGVSGFWQLSGHSLAAVNSSYDLLVGGDSSASAKIAMYGSTGNLALKGDNQRLTLGSAANLDLSFDGTAGKFTSTGDLVFQLDSDNNGLNALSIRNGLGADLFTVSEAQITSHLPTNFTSAGDVSMAYNLLFTNQTASYIKSNAPLYLEAGESFESNDLTLRTFNAGDVVLDAAGGVTLAQAQSWDLASSTTALNLASGLLNLDTVNGRIGIGTTAPAYKLDVTGDINFTGALRAGGLPGTTGQVLLSQGSGTPVWTDVSTAIGTNAWLQGGNTFGSLGVLGTNDNFGLQFKTNNAARMTITADGKVGIGTTDPQALLNLSKNSDPVLRFTSSYGYLSQNDSLGKIEFWNSDLSGTPGVVSSIHSYATSTFGSGGGLIFSTGQSTAAEAMRITETGNVGIGTTYTTGSRLTVRSSGNTIMPLNVLHANAPGVVTSPYLQVGSLTNPGSVFMIASSGYVGIGTTNPQTKLHLYATATGENTLRISNNANNYANSGEIMFLEDSQTWGTNAYGFRILHEGIANQLQIQSSATTTVTDILAINRTGNIGVGTTNPGTKLDVAGAIRTSDQLISTVATGTAPLAVTSTTKVANLNVDRIDDLDSTQFLRSDATDNYTSGTLTFDSGTELDMASGSTLDINGDLRIADTSIAFDGASTNFAMTGNFSVNTDNIFVNKSTGNVGIGDTTPASLFTVGANDAFQVNLSGNIVAIGGGAHSISNVSGDLSIAGVDDLLLSDVRVSNLRLSESDTALHVNLSQAIVDAINDVYGMATGAGGVAGFWQLKDTHNLSPLNSSYNLLVGGDSTSSAKIALLGATGRLGIGTTNPGAKLQINADASGIGQIIRANATTPGNMSEWQDGSGNLRAWVNSTGSIGLRSQSSGGPLLKDVGGSGNSTLGIRNSTDTADGNFYTDAVAFGESYQGIGIKNNLAINWASGSGVSGSTKDVGIKRNGTNSLQITDGSTGFGTLTAGKIGIGTTSPSNLLDIKGTNGTQVVRIGSNPATGVVGGYTFYQNNLSGLTSGKILGAHYNNSESGALYYSPNNGTNNWTPGWVLQTIVGNRAVTTASDLFNVGGKNSTDSVTLHVNNTTGQVGIGTTSPGNLLELGSDTRSSAAYLEINAAANQQTAIQFSSAGSPKWIMYRGANSSDLKFYDGTDRITFQAGGNVGIGTTDPQFRLDVAGAVRLGASGGVYDVLNTVGTGIGNDASGDLYWGNDPLLTSANIGDFGVSSVANSDGTLTISPTTGAVVASLNLANANTWTGAQTFSTSTYFPGSGIWDSTGKVGIGTTAPGASLQITPDSTSNYGLWVNTGESLGSDSIIRTKGRAVGIGYQIDATSGTVLKIGSGGSDPSVYLHVQSSKSTAVGQIIQGASAQTANLSEWKNNSGSLLTYINSSGNLSVSSKYMIDNSVVLTVNGDYKSNTLVGASAGNDTLTATDVTAVGSNAGTALTSGTYATFLGAGAGKVNTTGQYNTFIGARSGYTNVSANYNTYLGYRSGFASTGGSNTMIGYSAGHSSGAGTGNIFLGYSAGYNEVGSNKLYIENSASATPLIWGDFASDLVGIHGNLGIGTTAPVYKLDVTGDINFTGALRAGGLPGTTGQVLLSQGSGTPVWTDISTAIGTNAWLQGGNTFGALGVLGTNDNFGLQFKTNNLARMTILEDGKVGIGTTAPSDKLHVVGDLRLTGAFKDSSNSAGNSGYILSTTSTGTAWVDPTLAAAGAIFWNQADGALFPKNSTVDLLVGGQASASASFRVNANTGDIVSLAGTKWQPLANSTSALNIADAAGSSFVTFDSANKRVGIGTTAPTARLEVAQTDNNSEALTITAAGATGTGYLLKTEDSVNRVLTNINTAGIFTSRNYGGLDNAVIDLINLERNSAGTPTTGYGTGIAFKAKSTTTDARSQARIRSIWEDATDATRKSQLILSTFNGSTENDALVINSAGNVGIGTTSPTSLFNVYRNTAGQSSGLIANTSTTTPYSVNGVDNAPLSDNSRIGLIGVASNVGKIELPANPLGTSYTSAGVVGLSRGASGSNRAIGIFGYAVNNGASAATGGIHGGKFYGVAGASHNSTFADNFYGVEAIANASTALNEFGNTYGIKTTSLGKSGYTTYGGYFDAYGGTTNFGVYSAQGINYFAGNVGVGTTTPTAKLDIAGSASLSGTLAFRGTTDPKIDILNGENFGIRTSGSGDAGLVERLTISNTGLVGIGITNPQAQLDVAGNLNVSTYATVAASLSVGTGNAPAGPGNLVVSGTTSFGGLTYTWPTTQSGTQVLQNNGSGTLSWVALSSLSIGNADTLDSLDSLQFLRSDTSDDFTSGTLGMNSGTTLDVKSGATLDVNGNLSIADTDIALDGANTNLSATGNFSVNTDDLVVQKSNGYVGIGTTSPTKALEVNGIAKIGNVVLGNATLSDTNTLNLSYSSTRSLIENAKSDSYLRIRGDNTDSSGIIDLYARNTTNGPGVVILGGTPIADVSLRNVSITGVNAYASAVTNVDGGDVVINGGTAATGGSSGDVILASLRGNVGIGTTAPAYKLDVTGDINFTGALRAGGLPGTTGQVLLSQGSGTPVWTDVSTAIGSNAWLQGGNSFGTLGVLGTNDNFGLQFKTNNQARMTIAADGKVGVGTTSPSTTLMVNGNFEVGDGSSVNPRYSVWGGWNGSGFQSLQMLNSRYDGSTWSGNSGYGGWVVDTFSSSTANPDSNDYISWNYKTSGNLSNSGTAFLTLRGNGNVGIGTTNPGEKLEVNGNIKLGNGNQIRNSSGNNILNDNTNVISLGNGSTTTTHIMYGNVGIGTTNPSEKLDIVGNLKVSGTTTFGGIAYTWPATQAANRVLTTNGSGTLSWTDVNSLSFWQRNSGALAPMNITDSLLLGGTSSSSAIFALDSLSSTLTLKDSSLNTLFSVSPTQMVSNVPTSFTSSGDVAFGYNLNFTNQSSSFINSNAPLYIQAGESFESNDLTLRTYNSGSIVLDSTLTDLNGQLSVASYATIAASLSIGTGSAPAGPGHLNMTGNLVVGGTTSFGGIAYTWPSTQSNNYILTTNGSGTLSWTNPGTMSIGDADTLDTLHASSFLRSDASSALTTGNTLTINSGGTLDINGNLSIADTDIALDGASTNLTATGNFSINTDDIFVNKSTGNVGIGTTDPNYRLQVTGGNILLGDDTGSINFGGSNFFVKRTTAGLQLSGSGANDSARVVLNGSGYVGIGTTTPTAKLDIEGSASLSGTIAFRGTTDPKIDVLNNENFGLRFSTTGDAGLTEKLTVLGASGNVGIGVVNPTAKLQITLPDDTPTTAGILAQNTGGTQLITNTVDRDFSAPGNWTGASWAISSSTFLHTAGDVTPATLPNAYLTGNSIINGRTYAVTFTIAGMTTGTLTPRIGTVTGTAQSTNGAKTVYITANANNADLSFVPTSAFDGSIDTITVSRVTNYLAFLDNGRLGIGTNAPSRSLDINDNTVTTGSIINLNSGSITSGAGLYMNLGTTSVPFTGNFLDFRNNGTQQFYVTSKGGLNANYTTATLGEALNLNNITYINSFATATNYNALNVSSTQQISTSSATYTVDETMDQVYEAFRFNSGSYDNMASVRVRLKKSLTANNAGYLTAYLRADNAGVPAGTNLASGTSIYLDNIATTFTNYDFGLSYTPLTANTAYWIVIVRATTNADDIVFATTPAPENDWATSANGTDWTPQATKGYYYVYTRSSRGIYGNSWATAGVYGNSTHGTAINATSTTGIGLYSTSSYNWSLGTNGYYGLSMVVNSPVANAITMTSHSTARSGTRFSDSMYNTWYTGTYFDINVGNPVYSGYFHYYDGSTYTNRTTDAFNYGGSAYTLLADTNDYFYFGRSSATNSYRNLYFDIYNTPVLSGLTWEYASGEDGNGDCNAWTSTTPSVDETNGLTRDGKITFPSSTLIQCKVNGDDRYWFRVSASSVTTGPTATASNWGMYTGYFARFYGTGTERYRLNYNGDMATAGYIAPGTINSNDDAVQATRYIYDSGSSIALNTKLSVATASAYSTLDLYNNAESTTETVISQETTGNAINIITDSTTNAFYPGIIWSTQNGNFNKPKLGIYGKQVSSGTFMYLGTSNAFTTGLTNTAITIDYNGRVGIGNTAPVYNLDVTGDINITNEINLAGNPGTSGQVLTSGGNGAAAAWTSLSGLSVGNADTLDNLDSLQFLRSDTSDSFTSGVLSIDAAADLDINGDLIVSDADIAFDAANTNITATGNFSVNTDDLVVEKSTGMVGIGTTDPLTNLNVSASGDTSLLSLGATFRVANGGNSNAYALAEFESNGGNVIITNAGRVGIGAIVPNTNLEIVGSTAPVASISSTLNTSYSAFVANNDQSGRNLTLLSGNSGRTGTSFGVSNANLMAAYSNNAPLAFGTMNAYDLTIGTNNAARMTIASGGNVGVGTTNPSGLFSVGSTSQFQVNTSGIISAIDGVAHSIDDVSGNLTLNSNSATVSVNDTLSVTGDMTATGYISATSYVQGSNLRGGLYRTDNRTAAPADFDHSELNYIFGSFANTGGGPYADSLVMRGWNDGSGGSDNMISFSRGSIAARFYQQTYGSSSDFSSFEEFTFTGSGGTANYIPKYTDANTIGNSAIFDNAGNVGIGTTNPTEKLEVSLNSSTDFLSLNNSGIMSSQESRIVWKNGPSSVESAFITARPGASYNDGSLHFGLFNGTALSEKMRLTSGGYLGIGTGSVNPVAPLEVVQANSSTNQPLQRWSYFTPVSYNLNLKQIVETGIVKWSFWQTNNSTTYDNVLVLDRGSVGIGTTNPTARLSVSGDLGVSSHATISGSLALGNTSAVAGPGHLNMTGNLVVGGTTSFGGIAYTWPSSQSGTQVLQNNGSGVLSWYTLPASDNYGSWTAQDGDTTTYTVTSADTLQFAEGTGIDVNFTGDDVLTITNTDLGSSQNIFKNILVSGQSNVVADSNNDNLTFAAGTGITITTDAANDIITITATATGNADTLDNLDSLQFLRSDTSDDFTSGTLGMNSGTTLDVKSGATLDVNGNLSIADTDIALDGANTNLSATGNFSVNTNNLVILKANGNVGVGITNPGQKLDVAGAIRTNNQFISTLATGTAPLSVTSTTKVANLNVDQIDDLDSAAFLRSDTSDNFTSGTLTFNSGTELDMASGSTLDINGDLTIADTDIALDGANTNLSATGNFSVNTNNLVVHKSTGNVGIGITNPSTRLQVAGTLSPSATNTHDLGTTALYWNNGYINTLLSSTTYVTIDDDIKINGGDILGPSGEGRLTLNDTTDTIGASGYLTVSRGATITSGAATDVTLTLIGASAQSADYLRIASNGSSVGDILTVAASGNVGIGTTNPTSKLTIGGASSVISNTSGDITITPAGNTIFSAGNVGIGITNPAARLDVLGNLNVSTYATVAASLSVGTSNAPAGPGNLVVSGKTTFGGIQYTWPGTQAVGYILQTNGSGVLSWISTSGLADGGNAQTLDSLDSLQFLRSDTSDNFTSGTITFNSGTELDMASGSTLDINGNLSIADTDIALDGASTNLTATGNFSVNTNNLVILKANGNVGIGITNPSTRLQVAGTLSPSATNTHDLGTTALYWNNGYINTLLSSTTYVTIDDDLKINGGDLLGPSGEGRLTLNDTTDTIGASGYLTVSRGATITSGSATDVTLTLTGSSGQTADLFRIASYGSAVGDIFTVRNTGYVGIGTTNPKSLLVIGSYDSAFSSSLKQSLFSVDNTQLSQLEGGAYFGNVKLTENQFGLSNIGNTWVAKGSTGRNWYGIAMSSDGKFQTAIVNGDQIYVSTDYGATWTAKDSSRNWYAVDMSSDGKIQTAVVGSGQIYVSTDYGATWTAKDSSRGWNWVAMSSDGKLQTATVWGGQIYTSSDYGATWTAKDSSRNWNRVVMSSDGKLQSATVYGGQLYISEDYGTTWSALGSSRNWNGLAMSADGRVQTAVVNSGQIYVSTDYGATWTAKDSNRAWYAVSMSSDGKNQTAVVYGGQIYVSTDYGATWTAKDSSRNWFAVDMSSDGKVQIAVVYGGVTYSSFADSYLTGGNMGIGTTNPTARLHVDGNFYITNGDIQDPAMPVKTNYDIYMDGTGVIGYNSSDIRLKKNVQSLNINATDIVKLLRPVRFDWIDGEENQVGFVAQEVQPIIPTAVGSVQGSPYLAFSSEAMIPYIVKALQEQQLQMDEISGNLINITAENITANNASINNLNVATLSVSGNPIENLIRQVVEQMIAAGGIVASGINSTADVVANSLNIATTIITDSLTSNSVETGLIKPISDQDLVISLNDNQSVKVEGHLEAETASISAIDTDVLNAKKAVFDEIEAKKIKADQIDGLAATLSEIKSASDAARRVIDQILANNAADDALRSNLENNIATSSSSLLTQIEQDLTYTADGSWLNLNGVSAEFGLFSDYLEIQGTTTTQDLFVQNNLITSSISTEGDHTLFIQPTGMGTINLMADLMILDASGNVVINGDLTVTGQLIADRFQTNEATISGTLTINASAASLHPELAEVSGFGKLLAGYNTNGDLVASIDASGSANFNQLTTTALVIATPATQPSPELAEGSATTASASGNSTIGSSVLPAGQTEILIKNTNITPNTLIYLTPTSDTGNQVLFVKSKVAGTDSLPGEFVVSVNRPTSAAITFNYWLIQTR